MDQQHRFFGMGVAHQAPANGSFVPAPEVVARAHALACCASASWREEHLDGRSLLGCCSDTNREPMDALTEAEAAVLSTALLAWWERHGRGGIPWKQLPGGARPAPDQDLDPYGIWIAEVMLQQTQLAVALPYWDALDGGVSQLCRECWRRRLWMRCGCSGRVLAITRGPAGCMKRRSCWWVDPGPACLGGLDGVAGHWPHHRRQHPFQCLQCFVCRSWMATSNGCWPD